MKGWEPEIEGQRRGPCRDSPLRRIVAELERNAWDEALRLCNYAAYLYRDRRYDRNDVMAALSPAALEEIRALWARIEEEER